MRYAFGGGARSILSVLGCALVVGFVIVVGCGDDPEAGRVVEGPGPDAAVEAVEAADTPPGAPTSGLDETVVVGSLRSYEEEGGPLLGWIRQGRFNVRAGRVAILDYVHPNVKVFDDRLRLEFVAAVGDRRFPNEHGISDLFLTNDGTVVVLTESGWVIGLTRGEVRELGMVDQDDPGSARLRLAACTTGWAVVSEASGTARPIPLARSPAPGSPTVGPAIRRPTVRLATDPAALVELPLSRTDPGRVGAATRGARGCRVDRPARLGMDGPSLALPPGASPDELVVFPDPSGGGVVTLGGPGPWFAAGLLEAPEAGS